DQLARVEPVLLCVLEDPVERTPAILNRCRSERDWGEPILHVHHVHPPGQVWEREQSMGFLAASSPSSAMNENDRRPDLRWFPGRDHIELDVLSTCPLVNDLGSYLELAEGYGSPPSGRR